MLEDCNDLVICLIVVQKPQSADWTCFYDYVTVCNVFLSQYANIQRVAVSLNICSYQSLVGEFRHLRTAVCFRKKSIKRRNDVGEFLRTVK